MTTLKFDFSLHHSNCLFSLLMQKEAYLRWKKLERTQFHKQKHVFFGKSSPFRSIDGKNSVFNTRVSIHNNYNTCTHLENTQYYKKTDNIGIHTTHMYLFCNITHTHKHLDYCRKTGIMCIQPTNVLIYTHTLKSHTYKHLYKKQPIFPQTK